MAYLLDTNILSELRKGSRCDERVRAWAVSVRGERHCISVLSVGEIRKGIEILRRKAPDQCPAVEQWLSLIQAEYSREILPVTEAISERWGRLMAEQTLPVFDSLIAATALAHGLVVATRNTQDFTASGVAVVNPFA